MTIEMTDLKYLVRHSLKYGLMLSVLVTPFLGASLYVNPEIFVNDYPPDIREAVGPMSEGTRRQAMVAASVILPIMIGVPIYSLVRLKRQRPHLSFRSAFLSTFIVGNVFNLYDLVILDWLIFIVLQPEFRGNSRNGGNGRLPGLLLSLRGVHKGIGRNHDREPRLRVHRQKTTEDVVSAKRG